LSTLSIHRNGDCLLKKKSNKHNKYVVNEKLEHFDDISGFLQFLYNKTGENYK